MTDSTQGASSKSTATITVCSSCFQATCWQGIFYCDDYKSAETVEKTREDLEKLNLEHPKYWAAA